MAVTTQTLLQYSISTGNMCIIYSILCLFQAHGLPYTLIYKQDWHTVDTHTQDGFLGQLNDLMKFSNYIV